MSTMLWPFFSRRGSTVNDPTNERAEQDEFHWQRRYLYVVAHGFELALVVVITFVSCLLLVPLEKVFQHLCESIATISLVHCVDTVRIITDRASTFRNFQWRATEQKCVELARVYHRLADRTEVERGAFMVFAVISAMLWSFVSVSFACYLSPMSRGHRHDTLETVVQSVPSLIPDSWNRVLFRREQKPADSGDLRNPPVNQENREHGTDGVQMNSAGAMIPRVPALFLDLCVGFCAGVGIAISGYKVWMISLHPEELSVDWFVAQLKEAEKFENATAVVASTVNAEVDGLASRLKQVGTEG